MVKVIDMPKEIQLTQGQVAIVDDGDYGWLTSWKWYAQWNPKTKSFYAARRGAGSCAGGKDRRGVILMHREILGLTDKRLVNHWNHNTLDNQRHNLKDVNNAQNTRHSGKRCNNTSGFKGVTWYASPQKWGARIQSGTEKGRIFLGVRDTKIEAARLYDMAAIKYHGDFAILNFPREEYADGH
jgi:AP2 domain